MALSYKVVFQRERESFKAGQTSHNSSVPLLQLPIEPILNCQRCSGQRRCLPISELPCYLQGRGHVFFQQLAARFKQRKRFLQGLAHVH